MGKPQGLTPLFFELRRPLTKILHQVLQFMMRVFKTRVFDRWAGKAGVTDIALLKSAADIECGLVDADLGSNLFKQRVALPGRGKSGSTRILLVTRFAGTLYFLFGFEKKNRDNITQRELGIYQSLVSTLVVLNNEQIEAALKANELMEVQHEPND